MKLTKIALFAGAALLFASPAAAQDAWMSQVAAQLDAVIEALDAEGLSEATEPVGGALAEGAGEDVEFELAAGSYAIVGVCDADCSDLDLVLVNASGGESAADRELDDVPVVTFQADADGRYVVKVEMATCGTERCEYGVRVFHAANP